MRSRKIIAAMYIPAGVRHVVVQLAVGSVGEPVRIVTSSGLVLSEQHFELRGVKIAINGVERRLIGRVAVTQPGGMVIKILVIGHLGDWLDKIRVFETRVAGRCTAA